jgi:hypothetical protein
MNSNSRTRPVAAVAKKRPRHETPLARLVRRTAEIFAEYERAIRKGGVQKTPPKSAKGRR